MQWAQMQYLRWLPWPVAFPEKAIELNMAGIESGSQSAGVIS